MSIINLKERITNDNNQFEHSKKSVKSYILLDQELPKFEYGNNETLILNVGDCYIKNSQNIEIPKNGYVVKPGESVLFQTEQKIAIPLNVIGVIYGIGTNIFNGGFISAGKIDQGFNEHLKISFLNAGKQNIVFKKGDALACAIFFETEDTLSAAMKPRKYDEVPNYEMKKLDKFKVFLSSNWISILSIIIAIGTLFFEILNVFRGK